MLKKRLFFFTVSLVLFSLFNLNTAAASTDCCHWDPDRFGSYTECRGLPSYPTFAYESCLTQCGDIGVCAEDTTTTDTTSDTPSDTTSDTTDTTDDDTGTTTITDDAYYYDECIDLCYKLPEQDSVGICYDDCDSGAKKAINKWQDVVDSLDDATDYTTDDTSDTSDTTTDSISDTPDDYDKLTSITSKDEYTEEEVLEIIDLVDKIIDEQTAQGYDTESWYEYLKSWEDYLESLIKQKDIDEKSDLYEQLLAKGGLSYEDLEKIDDVLKVYDEQISKVMREGDFSQEAADEAVNLIKSRDAFEALLPKDPVKREDTKDELVKLSDVDQGAGYDIDQVVDFLRNPEADKKKAIAKADMELAEKEFTRVMALKDEVKIAEEALRKLGMDPIEFYDYKERQKHELFAEYPSQISMWSLSGDDTNDAKLREAFWNLEKAYDNTHDAENALAQDYKKVLENDPKNVRANYQMSVLLRNRASETFDEDLMKHSHVFLRKAFLNKDRQEVKLLLDELNVEFKNREKFEKDVTAENSMFIQKMNAKFKAEVGQVAPEEEEHAKNSVILSWYNTLTGKADEAAQKKIGDLLGGIVNG